MFYDRFWTKVSDYPIGFLLWNDDLPTVTIRVGRICVQVGAEAWIAKERGLDPSWVDRLPEMWHHIRGFVDGRRGYAPGHGRRPGAGDSVPGVRERQSGDLPRLGEQDGSRLMYKTVAELQQAHPDQLLEQALDLLGIPHEEA